MDNIYSNMQSRISLNTSDNFEVPSAGLWEYSDSSYDNVYQELIDTSTIPHDIAWGSSLDMNPPASRSKPITATKHKDRDSGDHSLMRSWKRQAISWESYKRDLPKKSKISIMTQTDEDAETSSRVVRPGLTRSSTTSANAIKSLIKMSADPCCDTKPMMQSVYTGLVNPISTFEFAAGLTDSVYLINKVPLPETQGHRLLVMAPQNPSDPNSAKVLSWITVAPLPAQSSKQQIYGSISKCRMFRLVLSFAQLHNIASLKYRINNTDAPPSSKFSEKWILAEHISTIYVLAHIFLNSKEMLQRLQHAPHPHITLHRIRGLYEEMASKRNKVSPKTKLDCDSVRTVVHMIREVEYIKSAIGYEDVYQAIGGPNCAVDPIWLHSASSSWNNMSNWQSHRYTTNEIFVSDKYLEWGRRFVESHTAHPYDYLIRCQRPSDKLIKSFQSYYAKRKDDKTLVMPQASYDMLVKAFKDYSCNAHNIICKECTEDPESLEALLNIEYFEILLRSIDSAVGIHLLKDIYDRFAAITRLELAPQINDAKILTIHILAVRMMLTTLSSYKNEFNKLPVSEHVAMPLPLSDIDILNESIMELVDTTIQENEAHISMPIEEIKRIQDIIYIVLAKIRPHMSVYKALPFDHFIINVYSIMMPVMRMLSKPSSRSELVSHGLNAKKKLNSLAIKITSIKTFSRYMQDLRQYIQDLNRGIEDLLEIWEAADNFPEHFDKILNVREYIKCTMLKMLNDFDKNTSADASHILSTICNA